MFDTKEIESEVENAGNRVSIYGTLVELKELSLKAMDDAYEPVNEEEQQVIEALRDGQYGVVQVYDEKPERAYGRASSLRNAKTLPDGIWEFASQKNTNEEGQVVGEVLARFLGEES